MNPELAWIFTLFRPSCKTDACAWLPMLPHTEPLCCFADDRSAPFLSLLYPLAKACNDGRVCDDWIAGVERRGWVVFHRELDFFCRRFSDKLSRNVETEVDAGRHPTAGDDIAVDNDPSSGRYRSKLGQELARSPMTGRAPAHEQPGGPEEK